MIYFVTDCMNAIRFFEETREKNWLNIIHVCRYIRVNMPVVLIGALIDMIMIISCRCTCSWAICLSPMLLPLSHHCCLSLLLWLWKKLSFHLELENNFWLKTIIYLSLNRNIKLKPLYQLFFYIKWKVT